MLICFVSSSSRARVSVLLSPVATRRFSYLCEVRRGQLYFLLGKELEPIRWNTWLRVPLLGLTLSLPKTKQTGRLCAIQPCGFTWSISNFPCSFTRNITSHSMKDLAFHSWLRWKMIILPILTTSLIHFLLKRLGECTCLNLVGGMISSREMDGASGTFSCQSSAWKKKNRKPLGTIPCVPGFVPFSGIGPSPSDANNDGGRDLLLVVLYCQTGRVRQFVTFLMKRGNRGKTKTRSNAFGNRLNAFESHWNAFAFFPFSSGRSHFVYRPCRGYLALCPVVCLRFSSAHLLINVPIYYRLMRIKVASNATGK